VIAGLHLLNHPLDHQRGQRGDIAGEQHGALGRRVQPQHSRRAGGNIIHQPAVIFHQCDGLTAGQQVHGGQAHHHNLIDMRGGSHGLQHPADHGLAGDGQHGLEAALGQGVEGFFLGGAAPRGDNCFHEWAGVLSAPGVSIAESRGMVN